MTALKFLAIGTLASLISTVIGDTATDIAALAAGVAGGAYLLAKLLRALRLAEKFLRHWINTVQILQALPAWIEHVSDQMKAVDDRLSEVEKKTDAIHEPVSAVARELDIHHRH